MIFIIGFSSPAPALKAFLAFKVKEYATDAYYQDTNITKLSIIAFNSAKSMSASNCTFNWSTADLTISTGIKNKKYTYVSKCHNQNPDDATYQIDGAAAITIPKSTATIEEFKAFDAINIYYDNVLYYSVNQTNAATVGFTPLTFFSGKMTDYKWEQATNFEEITTMLTGDQQLSTVDAKLFIAKFQGDYSYLVGTVIDANDKVACSLFFTSRNEAVCKLRNTTSTTAAENFFLVLKNSAGNVVFKHGFARFFRALEFDANGMTTPAKDVKGFINQTVERTVISWTIPPAPPATDSKSNPIMTTSFVINLRDNSTKTVDLKDDTCPYVNYVIQSNGSNVINGNNAATPAKTEAKLGYCYVTVVADTSVLVPWTDFVLNATLTDGSVYISTKAKLTPRMISDWAANSVNGSAFVISLSDINKSGLTGGEVAAIVIGSCAGALLLALLAGIFIRWCAYGCMNPAMVAAPKMMM